MTIDIDKVLSLNTFGHETSEEALKRLLGHEKIKEKNGELQLRLVALWVDGDKDARLGRFEDLLQYVKLDTISYEKYAEITNWENAIIDCRQTR